MKEAVHNSAWCSEFGKTLSGESPSLVKVSILLFHDISTSDWAKDLEKIPQEGSSSESTMPSNETAAAAYFLYRGPSSFIFFPSDYPLLDESSLHFQRNRFDKDGGERADIDRHRA